MKKTKGKSKKNRLAKLVANKGFYIALFTLIAVVGFYVYARNLKTSVQTDILSFDENAWQEAVAESGIEVIDIDRIEEKSQPTPAKKVPPQNEQTNDELTVETTAEAEPEFAMIKPCQGKIVAECSVDELVYCMAMDDWRTHNGMDIAAPRGNQVKAAESGVVSKVYEDELLGIVVEIEHRDGISSVYANLQNIDFISAGTKVERGDIIGGVGTPGALEANAEPHLHFEVLVNGEYKNPAEFIKN